MIIKIVVVCFILLFFHFLIKNYLLNRNASNTDVKIEYDNTNNTNTVFNNEEFEYKNDDTDTDTDTDTKGILKKNGRFTGINTDIDDKLEKKIEVQFNIENNEVKTCDKDVKNELLEYINSKVDSKTDDIYKGYDEIKSQNVVINNKPLPHINEKNDTFNEITDIKDVSNSSFCPPTDKANVKNIPLSDTSCVQGIDNNSKWRGKNVLLNKDAVLSENIMNGGVMDGGLLAYDLDDALYSEYNF
jgi:hypothetical protein